VHLSLSLLFLEKKVAELAAGFTSLPLCSTLCRISS
jgi:hypothetical protein